MSRSIELMIGVLFLVCVLRGQTICPNAFYTSTGNFIFNNQGCEGFSYNNTFGVNTNSVNCIDNTNPNCYYSVSSGSPQISKYVFCNYTLSSCVSCSDGQNCNGCLAGFYLYTYNTSQNLRNCQACSSNCFSCQNNNNCTNCNSGYFMNLYNNETVYYNCQACSSGCQTCPASNTCTQCLSGYYLYVYNANQSLEACQLCNVTFPGCASCTNGSACATCSAGYYPYTYNLNQGYTNCISCSSAIPGCQLCSNQNTCSQCSPQYINYQNQCYTQSGELVSGIDPFSSGGSTAAEIVMDGLIFLILVAIIYAFFAFFIQKKRVPAASSSGSSGQQRGPRQENEPAKLYQPTPEPQRTSEMKEPHEMRRDSLNRNMIKEPISTKNAHQYVAQNSIRDELVNERTDRTISPN